MNTTSPPMPVPVRNQLLQFGIAAMVVGGHPDLPMTDVVKTLLSESDDMLGAKLGSVVNGTAFNGSPRPVLSELNTYLDSVPRQDCPYEYLVAQIVLTAFAILSVALRLICRYWVTRKISRSDWIMLSASILAIVGVGNQLEFGSNEKAFECHHVWDRSFNQWKAFYLKVVLNEITYAVLNFLVKLSWLLLYWDLTPIPWFRAAIIAVGAFAFGSNGSGILVAIFRCNRVNWWDNPLTVKCVDAEAAMRALLGLVIASDLTVVLLPIPLVFVSLHIKLKEKIVLAAMFGTGLIACAAAVVRLVYAGEFVSDPDGMYSAYAVTFCSQLEGCLAIMISCVPSVRAFIRSYYHDSRTKLQELSITKRRASKPQEQPPATVRSRGVPSNDDSVSRSGMSRDEIAAVAAKQITMAMEELYPTTSDNCSRLSTVEEVPTSVIQAEGSQDAFDLEMGAQSNKRTTEK